MAVVVNATDPPGRSSPAHPRSAGESRQSFVCPGNGVRGSLERRNSAQKLRGHLPAPPCPDRRQSLPRKHENKITAPDPGRRGCLEDEQLRRPERFSVSTWHRIVPARKACEAQFDGDKESSSRRAGTAGPKRVVRNGAQGCCSSLPSRPVGCATIARVYLYDSSNRLVKAAHIPALTTQSTFRRVFAGGPQQNVV